MRALIMVISVVAPLAIAPRATSAQPVPLGGPSSGPSFSLPPTRTGTGTRIEIHPRPLLYRRCVDWYELQHRPSGTVLFPQMRCYWVRG